MVEGRVMRKIVLVLRYLLRILLKVIQLIFFLCKGWQKEGRQLLLLHKMIFVLMEVHIQGRLLL